jgi:hypothetical protein
MKRVYIASDLIDAEVMAGFLVSRGIRAIVRNAHLWPLAGLSMMIDAAPAVWVTDDLDEEDARKAIADCKRPASVDLAPWICQTCEEENDGPFGLCWKCGRRAPDIP